MANSFEDVLNTLRELSNNKREQGRRFECLMQSFLQEDPEYKNLFSDVWLWEQWPDRDGPDTGIDLVARERETGRFWAIQCKFYKKEYSLAKSDIDSFLAASGTRQFHYRMIISTTDQWTGNLRREVENQKTPCRILRFQTLAKRDIVWPDLARNQTTIKINAPKKPWKHQEDAIEKVIAGLKVADRGKLIMACGTGKTLTSIRIAEKMLPQGGTVLFLAPSLSLLSQNICEWAYNKTTEHTYLAVCSDTGVGRHRNQKTEEDANDPDAHYTKLEDLAYPATTNSKEIRDRLGKRKEKLQVVFSTYHSLEVLHLAQKDGAAEFDLVICDEAHKTAGQKRPDGTIPEFSQIHDANYLRARKRLYMTATPKIFAEKARQKADEAEIDLFSMDDPKVFGEELYRLSFGKAVENRMLADYRVIILCVSKEYIANKFPAFLADQDLKLPDAVKMAGCWRALTEKAISQREASGGDTGHTGDAENTANPADTETPPKILSRSVAFFNRIKDSKHFQEKMQNVVKRIQDKKTAEGNESQIPFGIEHVDGTQGALERSRKLDWLRDASNAECRILMNVRCLSEGIDVPALDAVLFMQPRRSEVDVVQSVGRVMRKAPDKKYGYIILPVVAPANADEAKVLDKNEDYKTIWEVLNALRAHDDRFNAMIHKIDLNHKKPDQVDIIGIGAGGEVVEDTKGLYGGQLDLRFGEIEEKIYATIVKKCGERLYWEDWAKNAAELVSHTETRIRGLVKNKEGAAKEFNKFLKTLRGAINPAITEEDARMMLGQHAVTQAIFEALFADYEFAQQNPVSQRMNAVLNHLGQYGLQNEVRDLESFYEDVRKRVAKIDNAEGRQAVMASLYEKFFSAAFAKEANRLGIVYTPPEVADFILHSADAVARQEFGEGLADENVNILDPFTGTGLFVARLLQNKELIGDDALKRKFQKEVFAYETVLLAYYIAAVNIEAAYQSRLNEKHYEPFKGIALTDTFQRAEKDKTEDIFKDDLNAENANKSDRKDIRIIIGNPPYSAGQRNENEDNKNLIYEKLDKQIRNTYANPKYNKAQNRNSLYDSYIRAIRWASERIGDRGMIAFVTNGGFLYSAAGSGVRKCLADEFSKIYCLNLRGNARTSGEVRRKEKDNVFGMGTRTAIVIIILIKNGKEGKANAKNYEILYRDIGDYLKREEKLAFLREKKSVAGITDWQTIQPDEYHDWVDQRINFPAAYIPLGDQNNKKVLKNARTNTRNDKRQKAFNINQPPRHSLQLRRSLFLSFCLGVKTNKDPWIYNFEQQAVADNMHRMISFYDEQRKAYHHHKQECEKQQEHPPSPDDFVNNDPTKISWDGILKNELARNKFDPYREDAIRNSLYRPFVKKHLYFDRFYNNSVYRLPSFFPKPDSPNKLICITATSVNTNFSTLITDLIPDLHILSTSQVFPLYYYDEENKRHSNITPAAIAEFKEKYQHSVSAEDIFHYVYGLLNWPAFKVHYADTLKKELPRIPLLKSYKTFCNFRDAGEKLANLHLNYEAAAEYNLRELNAPEQESESGDLKLNHQDNPPPTNNRQLEKIRFAGKQRQPDKTQIVYNPHLTLAGIPLKAYEYQLCGRSPLEWVMEFYQKKTNKDSGITDDPNALLREDPNHLVSLIKRLVTVSIETTKIIETFPEKLHE